jgi:CRP-like cAMP-binding protein
MNNLLRIMTSKILKVVHGHFQQWRNFTIEERKQEMIRQGDLAIEKVVKVMATSVRGKRSLVEKETLGKFLRGVTCLPKLMSSELDILCNEIDWVACYGSSLLFLQGDYGACFYMIANGTVELYLADSKEKEMANARQYGDMRGKYIDMAVCANFGLHVVTLRKGQGFGELAILSATHKFRALTAVASHERSLMFVVHTDTYK